MTQTKSVETKFNFQKFEDIPVSTKTFIVMTNLSLDIKKLFDFLPVTNYIVVPKKRGRKKKVYSADPNKSISDGSIITIDLANNVRGVSLKKKKKKEGKSSDYFRNSITIVMIMDGKKINFKISNNGKFQMTGIKKDQHAESCIKTIWNYIRDSRDIYTIPDGENFRALFIPAMRNIDFSLGFHVDRKKLDQYFNNKTEYCSLLETSIGYTGVNIKIPISKPITELQIKQISYDKDWSEPVMISYQNYLDTLKPKEKQKKISKDRFNTFLVFQSGKVIMSSMCEDFARDTYKHFLDIISDNQEEFQEKLQS
jgi:TATA-box binding protein (TBP) (component of TFIID and TFIIIB)